MKKRKIAILLSALMLCTNVSYVGIDGSAEEPKNVVEESELQITEIESGATVQNQKTGRYGAAVRQKIRVFMTEPAERMRRGILMRLREH